MNELDENESYFSRALDRVRELEKENERLNQLIMRGVDRANAFEVGLKREEAENARLRTALQNLLIACYTADAREELGPSVDGSLLDAAREVLKGE